MAALTKLTAKERLRLQEAEDAVANAESDLLNAEEELRDRRRYLMDAKTALFRFQEDHGWRS